MNTLRFIGAMTCAVINLAAEQADCAPNPASTERPWLRSSASKANEAPRPAESYTLKGIGVLAVAGVGGYLLWRRRQSSGTQVNLPSTIIKIRSLTRISARAQIVAVEVQGRVLLLGTTDTNITNLGWLDEATGGDFDSSEDEPDTRGVTASYGREETKSDRHEGALNTLKHTTYDKRGKPGTETNVRKPSRFRELLADAIGISSNRGELPPNVSPVAASDHLAASVKDRYVGREHSQRSVTQVSRDKALPAALINVEGQAKGLVARLNKPSS